MSDSFLIKLNSDLRKYDQRLYAIKTRRGMVQVWREHSRLKQDYILLKEGGHDVGGSRNAYSDLILCLTDNWSIRGNPVSWGILPVLDKIRESDYHRDSEIYEKHVQAREKREQDEARQRHNEMRALAADSRKDFAKMTNDINTSTMAKV